MTDSDGFAKITDVALAMNKSVSELRQCVSSSFKKDEARFELQDWQGCSYIRAVKKRRIGNHQNQQEVIAHFANQVYEKDRIIKRLEADLLAKDVTIESLEKRPCLNWDDARDDPMFGVSTLPWSEL